jgi:hypothetical protein
MMSDTKDSVIRLASKIAKLLARLPARDPDIDRHSDRGHRQCLQIAGLPLIQRPILMPGCIPLRPELRR